MKKLHEILEIASLREDTDEKVLVLKVKPGSQMDLIGLGFNGNERLFRLKVTGLTNWRHTNFYCAFFDSDLRKGSTFEWGGGSTTCAEGEFREHRDKIVNVAKNYFNFNMD
jgi:hypothetical protein